MSDDEVNIVVKANKHLDDSAILENGSTNINAFSRACDGMESPNRTNLAWSNRARQSSKSTREEKSGCDAESVQALKHDRRLFELGGTAEYL